MKKLLLFLIFFIIHFQLVVGQSSSKTNNTNYNIPDAPSNSDVGTQYSSVVFNNLPSDASITNVSYNAGFYHTYHGDLAARISTNYNGTSNPTDVIFTAGSQGAYTGGFSKQSSTSVFNGMSPNQTFYLRAWDTAPDDTGYINYFQVTVYYTVPSPSVSSVTPTSANINEEISFTIRGTNLTSGMGFFVANLENLQEQSGGTSTRRYFKGTFQQYAGTKAGIVKDAPNGNTLFNFSVNVRDNTPKITSVSPLTADINEEVIFTINGTNLTSGLGFFVANLENPQELSGGSSTRRYFKGTFQQYAGSKSGIVKDAPNGNTLFNFSVNVQDNTPKVTSVSPLTANINEEVTFTINGTNLTSGMGFFVANLENPQELSGGSSTIRYFKGIFQQYAGSKSGIVKVEPNGNTLFNFSVNVQDNTPKVTSVSPLTANINEEVTFTINGTNLTSGMGFFVANLENLQEQSGGTSTRRYFKGTFQQYAGTKSGVIKDAPNGNELFNFSVNVQNTTCNYTDALLADWWYDAVQDLCGRDILDDDGECQPTEVLNKASIAKLTYLAIDLDKNPLANNYENPFSDLKDKKNEWYYPYIINLSYLEFTDNTSVFNRSVGDFNPSSGISRAHSLKVLFEAFNIDETNNSDNNPYNDVSNTHNALDYIIKARDLGIIKLDASSQFRPNENILRAEYFVLLHEVLTIKNIAIPSIADSDFYEPNTNTSCAFIDVDNTDWWYDAALDLCDRNIIDGNTKNEGKTRPTEELNRAELAKLAYLSIGMNSTNSYADAYPSPFNDLQTKTDTWYYSFAKNLSYLEFADYTAPFDREYFNFRPSAGISRAHTLKVLLEAFNIDETDNTGSNPFSDVVTTGEQYDANYIVKARDLGIIKYDASKPQFEPNKNIIRAEAFVMLHNMLTVLKLTIPNITASDFYKAGNYRPKNLNNFSAMHSGNFSHYTKTSFGISSVGIPLVFSHTYNSYLSDMPNTLTPIQPLGKLWSHSFNAYLQEIDGDIERPNDFRVVFTLPNGGFQTYKKQGSTYVPETEGIYDELKKISSSKFILTTKGQIVYTFEKLSGTVSEFPFVLTSINDRNNNTLTIAYENAYKSGFKRIEEVIGTTGRKLEFNYHTQSDLISKVKDPLGRDIHFIYTSDGYLRRYTNPKNGYTSYNYGTGFQKELLMRITLPKGNLITNTYLKKKLQSSKTNGNNASNYNYDNSNKTTITSPKGIKTETFYNDLGNPERIVQGSTTVNIGYTDSNHKNYPTSVTYNGQNTSVTYDTKGNVLQRKLPENVEQNFTYTPLNDIETYTDPKKFEYKYDYNTKGNLTSIETPRGTTNFTVNTKGQITNVTNPENISVAFEYDDYGNNNKTTAPKGIVSSSSYDKASRLTSITNSNGHTISYILDDNDNLLEEAFNGQSTKYNVDANDNIIKIINAKNNATTLTLDADDDTLSKVQFGDAKDEYTYFDDGSVKTYKTPKGVVFYYTYDDELRLKSVSGGGQTIGYTYDSKGRAETVTNENGTIRFYYDNLDRVTQTKDHYENFVKYAYDKNSNITKITYPNNKVVTYSFYDDNLLHTVTDWNGKITSYSYRKDGLLSSTTYANGTVRSLSYDEAGRMTNKRWGKSDGSIINAYTFELDKLGNHTKEIKTEPFGVIPFDSQNINNTFNNVNEITSDGTNSFAFDKNGNNISNGKATFSFDVYDRLTNVNDTGFNASYKYDASGNRRERIVNGNTQRFVLDILGLSKVLLETDASNIAQNYYVYGLGLISRIDNSNTTHYYHDDFRGSIIALTDNNETITHKYQYTDFGSIAQIEEANHNPYRYVGKHGIQFEENGLYFMRARYYDANTGRFLTEDPVWATNLYPYAGNNPVTNIDPSGNISQEADALLTALFPAYGVYKAYNFTTQLGADACKSYSYGYITSESWVGKTGNAVGGISCLWTPETALETAFTLGTAGIGTGAGAVAKGGQTVIGEGMKRVSIAASKNANSIILKNMSKFTGTSEQITSQMMNYNRKWILQQMRSGRPILDIGLDPARKIPSIFYQMEQSMVKNYLRLHPNAFKIIN